MILISPTGRDVQKRQGKLRIDFSSSRLQRKKRIQNPLNIKNKDVNFRKCLILKPCLLFVHYLKIQPKNNSMSPMTTIIGSNFGFRCSGLYQNEKRQCCPSPSHEHWSPSCVSLSLPPETLAWRKGRSWRDNCSPCHSVRSEFRPQTHVKVRQVCRPLVMPALLPNCGDRQPPAKQF